MTVLCKWRVLVRTSINISNNDLRALVRKQPRCFGADALACAGDDCYLAGQHAGGVVEVLVHLIEAVGGSHFWFLVLGLC